MTLARIAFAASMALLVSSCASAWQATEKTPDRGEIVGSYDIQGDGLGVCMSIVFNESGSYTATWCGGEHRGEGSSETHGLWQLERKHIFFYDADGTYDATAYLNHAEAFYYKDVPAFALARHLTQGRVHEWFVFIKQPRQAP